MNGLAKDRVRVLVIGLDGATPEIMFKLAEKGDLSNIKDLISHGAYGKLKSTIPPLSPTAWASLATGVNPGKHGIYGYSVSRNVYEEGFPRISLENMGVYTIWELASLYGKKVCVISYPFTYPPKPVNGILLSGMGAPRSRNFVYPAELEKFLVDEIGYYPDYDRKCLTDEKLYDEEMNRYISGVHRAAKHFLQHFDWDLLVAVFVEPDTAQHFFWHRMDKILKCYVEMDHIVGDLVKIARSIDEKTHIFIISDHGGRPLNKLVVLNNWLIKEGWLKLRKRALSEILRKFGINRENIKRILERVRLSKIVKETGLKASWLPSKTKGIWDIDWDKTLAYAHQTYGQIFINYDKVKTREDIIRLANQIANKLKDLTDPEDGQLIVKEIYLKHQIFSGSRAYDAPDIYVVPNDGYDFIAFHPQSDMNSLILQSPRSGTHSQEGIIICNGPGIKKGLCIDASIVDIAPTVLYLLDIPIPTYIDGKPLLEILEDNLRSKHALKQLKFKERTRIKQRVKVLRKQRK